MSKLIKVAHIYKITYPNGKIYVGQDRTADLNYYGSADTMTIVRDFPAKARADFTIRKQVLRTLRGVTIQEINAAERKLIIKLKSSDPKVGYNRTHGQRRTRLREETV